MREAATLQAAAALASGRDELPAAPGGWAAGGHAGRAAARMALKAATACSSAGRRTPLHIAAEQGVHTFHSDVTHATESTQAHHCIACSGCPVQRCALALHPPCHARVTSALHSCCKLM
jgi:hypothetical protein